MYWNTWRKKNTERKQEFTFMLASKICWWKWCFNLYGCRDTHLGTLLLILLLILTQGFHFLMEWDLFLMNSMRWSTWYCNVCLTSSELCLNYCHKLFQSLKKSCGGEYQSIDPENSECLENLEARDKVFNHNYVVWMPFMFFLGISLLMQLEPFAFLVHFRNWRVPYFGTQVS